MMPVGLIPNIAKKHRRIFQRLDAFELNLMYHYSFPVFGSYVGTVKHVRCIQVAMVMDYVEFCGTTFSSQGGKLDACNQCNIRGRYAQGVKYHGSFLFASPTIKETLTDDYRRNA